jgi:hypothetical protein
MTPQPQQPTEYIITMSRIIKARNMLMYDGYKNADVLDRMVNLLRSRPAPSPETITKELALELCMDARKDAAAQAREEIRS